MSFRRGPRGTTLVSTVTLAVLILDLASKWVARRQLTSGEERWLVDSVLGLQLLRNRGVAFGLFEGRWSTLAMIMVAILALVWLIVAQRPGESLQVSLGAGGMLGGAFGNLIDRLPDGSVTDFVAIGPWPRFNVADTALTLGLVLLAMQQLYDSRRATAPPVGET